MRVSAKAEYACIAMLELAANYPEARPLRIKSIADAHDIPLRFLVQILLQLKGAGLVVSVRGASGGYQLARPPETITLADAIQVIDRPTEPRSSAAVPGASAAKRALRSVWAEAGAVQQRLLEEITFAELVHRTQPESELSYQI